jgi:hypothetical protein
MCAMIMQFFREGVNGHPQRRHPEFFGNHDMHNYSEVIPADCRKRLKIAEIIIRITN